MLLQIARAGALICLLAPPLASQDYAEAGAKARGERLTLKIAVIGPGDALYFWWGHIALIIEDEAASTALFYDYGVFSFENKNFFTNFALGRLLYSCRATPVAENLYGYIRTNRDITVYTLDIAPEKREEIRRFAEKNILPENRDYYYHHFKDNCATRIRDLIDLAVDGQFKDRFGAAPGRYTLRQHVRRHTWFSPFIDWILNFWMGQDIDTPITVWQEMFLPSEIGRRIEGFQYLDPSGARRVLVREREAVNTARNRPAVLEAPRRQWIRALPAGLGIAGYFIALGIVFRKDRASSLYRRLCGAGQSLLGLFFGLAGSVLFFMTFFTNHDYTYHNSNILYINPLLLAALPLGILYAGKGHEKRRFFAGQLLRSLWTYTLFGCILSIVIKLLPDFYQQNQVTEVLVMPFALVLSFMPRWIGRRARKQAAGGKAGHHL
ncbi:MAG: DUF4105 domain-containing protein [Spirochaetaceae bacterium]|nr:DUF4105 domain-containing protein [Spirochaetaceae bacterium]